MYGSTRQRNTDKGNGQKKYIDLKPVIVFHVHVRRVCVRIIKVRMRVY